MEKVEQADVDRLHVAGTKVPEEIIDIGQRVGQVGPVRPIGRSQGLARMEIEEIEFARAGRASLD
jgi:hypothetical protein